MHLRHLVILAAGVAALGGAAYYFTQERKALQSEGFIGGPFTPGLDVKVNQANNVRLESQEGGVLELKRGDDTDWTISTHYGYPAHQERVANLLKRVATLKTIEPKTAKPENHAQLNLDDPAGADALGTRITVKDGDETLIDIVAGLSRVEAEGGNVFIRRWEQDETWLADGVFKPRRRLLDLIDRNVVNVDGRRIRTAHITHPDGNGGQESAVVAKATPDQAEYTLAAAIPDGMQPKASHDLSTAARVTEFLILEKVLPAGEIALISPIVSVYETFDGLRISFTSAKQADGKIWMTMTASAAPRWDGLDLFMSQYKGEDSETGRIADQFKTADAVATEIAAMSSKTNGWAYLPTEYKAGQITVTAADLLEAPKPAAPAGANQ